MRVPAKCTKCGEETRPMGAAFGKYAVTQKSVPYRYCWKCGSSDVREIPIGRNEDGVMEHIVVCLKCKDEGET